jgi:hypothetical protein
MPTILVAGGRDYWNKDCAFDALDEVAGMYEAVTENPIVIVQGGERGADSLARQWARDRGHQCITVEPDWSVGKAAGPIRNQKMLDEHKPDHAVIFPGGRGTLDMLTRLFKARVNTWVVGD